MKTKIIELIKEEMKKQNISLCQLSNKLNKNKSFVSRVLTGEHNYTIDTIESIAVVLNINFEISIKDVK